ncbi:MAG: hypothetical protein ACRC80_37620 [Waterburya sp.]
MSRQRRITIKICKRAAYFLFNHSSETSRVLRDNSNDIATLRKLITRCYQIS